MDQTLHSLGDIPIELYEQWHVFYYEYQFDKPSFMNYKITSSNVGYCLSLISILPNKEPKLLAVLRKAFKFRAKGTTPVESLVYHTLLSTMLHYHKRPKIIAFDNYFLFSNISRMLAATDSPNANTSTVGGSLQFSTPRVKSTNSRTLSVRQNPQHLRSDVLEWSSEMFHGLDFEFSNSKMRISSKKDDEDILELWDNRIKNGEQSEIKYVTVRELLDTEIVYIACPEDSTKKGSSLGNDAAISYSCMELSLRLFLIVVMLLIIAPAFISK